MLDLQCLQRIQLTERPLGQRLAAPLLLFDYWRPPHTEIVIEGLENLPRDRSVFIAMNHSDRFNYFPFQVQLWRQDHRFTATWVKGKYFGNPVVSAFLQSTNNIPVPSRGYIIATDFLAQHGRKPTGDEYRLLRDLVDEGLAAVPQSQELAALTRPHGGPQAYRDHVVATFLAMMTEVVRLNTMALTQVKNHVLVFPDGTRRRRLGRGHTGIAQMAQHLGAAIVPVGCNGCDRVYPGDLPISRGGRIVYRVGPPLEIDGPELGEHRIHDDFMPFTLAAEARFGDRFRATTDVVMRHINGLLDPEYQFEPEPAATSKDAVSRFV